MSYVATQQQWLFSVEYNDFEFNSAQLLVSPNILRGYKNILPFGILCASIDGQDPFYISDFVNNRIELYLLDSEDVGLVEETYFN